MDQLTDENETLLEEAKANLKECTATRQRIKVTEDLLEVQTDLVVDCRIKINNLQQEKMSLFRESDATGTMLSRLAAKERCN